MAARRAPHRRSKAPKQQPPGLQELARESSRKAVAAWRKKHGDRLDPRIYELTYQIGLRHSPLLAALAAWKGGNPAGLVAAIRIFGERKLPLPEPVWKAVVVILEDVVRTAPVKSGRGQLANWAAVRNQDRLHLERWQALRAARATGLKGADAYNAARAALAKAGIHAEVKTIKDSYEEVQRSRKMARTHGLHVGRFYPAI